MSRARLAERFRRHGRMVVVRQSPLYVQLIERAAGDVEAGGPCWSVMEGREDDPRGSVPTLRLLGAVHRLVLEGRAPELAAHYPSAGGELGDPAAAWAPFLRTVAANVEELRELVRRPLQTNEVARAGALAGGFLEVARRTGLPLRLLEVGASAGLLLRWDRYRYEAPGGAAWGDPAARLRLALDGDRPPPLHGEAAVSERSGCDRSPLDPRSEEDRLTLRSFVWPDQPWRHEELNAALDVAAEVPAVVDRAGAADWVERRLAEQAAGAATVVFHSVVLQYLDDEERERFKSAVRGAGERATPDSPLAWLSMEGAGELCDLSLTLWPGGEERLLAKVGYHGRPVHWL